jgi:hypothetical protein
VGNVAGDKGRSLYVRLSGEGAGRWTDAATGEHGDLLDLIRFNKNLRNCREALEEAQLFLREPLPVVSCPKSGQRSIQDRLAAVKRLHALARPVPGTLAETYLRTRGIMARLDWPSLRFHPACYYRADDKAPLERWPALIAVVTDLSGGMTGLQRTYLARDGGGKAPLADPRRAMGQLRGNAVRFGEPADIMAAGEGVETVLSLFSLFPAIPMAAALSAAHLAALLLPSGLRRLYVLRDNDAAGLRAADRLAGRARNAGIDCHILRPSAKDLNDDLRVLPAGTVLARMLAQLEPEDRVRFHANCLLPRAL